MKELVQLLKLLVQLVRILIMILVLVFGLTVGLIGVLFRAIKSDKPFFKSLREGIECIIDVALEIGYMKVVQKVAES